MIWSITPMSAETPRREADVREPGEPTGSSPTSDETLEVLHARPTAGSGTTEIPSADRDAVSDDRIPSRIRYIGDYELLHVLGRGGMGIVYEARQISLDRPVAVKLLRSGAFASSAEIRRFRNEAEAVARLDHPSIVPVYEIGEFEGSPYFSMKLIRGKGLNASIDAVSRNPTLAAELVVTVAGAVHHAHQLGILHRDLKPSNILISDLARDDEGRLTRARAHVTDFGLAKQLDVQESITRTGEVIGTPAYMAPEVASGDASDPTVAADVYGLGSILYASLTGRAPYVGDTALAILDQVRHRDPEPPSRLRPDVPRDLELICLKAQAREPSRRYDSARALADDLGNWLEMRPIQARKVGVPERVWLWCRRRPALAWLTAALLIATLGGVLGITWNWLEVRRQKELLSRANRELARERDSLAEINRFLNRDILAAGNPEFVDRAETLTVEQALDRASASIESRFRDRPDVEASVRETLGESYHALGLFEKARIHLERATDLHQRARGRTHPSTLTASDNLAALLLDLGETEAAERIARATVEDWLRSIGPNGRDTLRSQSNLAAILQVQGDYEQAQRLHESVLARRLDLFGAADADVLTSQGNLATLYHLRGKDAEAEELLRRVLATREATLRPEHPLILITLSNLGASLHKQKKLEEAEVVLARTLEGFPRVMGEHSPATSRARCVLSAVLLELGRAEEALALLRPLMIVEGGKSATDALVAVNNYAMALARLDRLEEAEPLMRACFHLRAVADSKQFVLVQMRTNFAFLLLDLGQNEEAVSHLETALPVYRSVLGPEHSELANALIAYGHALTRVGRAGEAMGPVRQGLAIRIRILPEGDRQITSAESSVGAVHLALGQLDEAEPLLVRSIERLIDDPKVPANRRAHAVDRVVALYTARNNPQAADAWRARRPGSTRRWPVVLPASSGAP